VPELPGSPVECIQQLISTNPDRAITVLEGGVDVNSAQAIGIITIMLENLKGIAVEPIDAMLRAEPHETVVVLNYLSNAGLREALGQRHPSELDIALWDETTRYDLRQNGGRRDLISCLGKCSTRPNDEKLKEHCQKTCPKRNFTQWSGAQDSPAKFETTS
jgi:hypothetical protein